MTTAPKTHGPAIYAPAIKRSVTIAGHETSVTLEPIFWVALEAAASTRTLPLNALIAAIDAERLTAPAIPNLASALRSWALTEQQCTQREPQASVGLDCS